jgi:outer membrane murein-binding lipoprotein Lpp
MKKLMLGAALALALVAAGCGGGGAGDELTKEEYSSQLNAICTDLNAKNDEIGEPQSLADVGEKGDDLLAAFDEAIAEVEDLNPPADLEEAHNEFVDLGHQTRDLVGQLVDAAQEDPPDEAKINELGPKIDPLDAKSNEIAKNELGAPACAEET